MALDSITDLNLDDTPKFDKPPVVETVLSVQFKPLPGMRVTHFGQFHELLKPKGFETVEQYPPLDHQIEQKHSITRFIPFPLMQSIVPRVWFLSSITDTGQRVIQFQPDRLVQNWRTPEPGNHVYPSYSDVRAGFEDAYKAVGLFAMENRLGPVTPDQCEVVYVNQIPIAEFGNPSEAFKACFGISIPATSPAHMRSGAENLAFNCAYWNDHLRGRLLVEAATASIIGTASEKIDLRITARGAPVGTEPEDVMNWLNIGHYFVVNTFADITTETMHKKWVRTR